MKLVVIKANGRLFLERRQDIALGLVFLALGLIAAFMARDWRGASGTYPMVLGLVLAGCGLGVAGRALRLPDGVRNSLQAVDFDKRFARSFSRIPVVLGTARRTGAGGAGGSGTQTGSPHAQCLSGGYFAYGEGIAGNGGSGGSGGQILLSYTAPSCFVP